MGQNPNDMDLANKFVAQFDSFDNIVIEGVSSDGSNDPEAIDVGFKYYKFNNKAKYFENPINLKIS